MKIYPPAPYRPLRTTSGGVDDFMTFFRDLRSRWVKVEFLQEYDESGFAGYEAFKRGDYIEAARLVHDQVVNQDEIYSHAREQDVTMIRIRVCKTPLTSYLIHYEFAAYLADIEQGEDVRLIDARDIGRIITDMGVSDFVLFDDRVVIALIYNLQTRSLEEARLVEDPSLVKTYASVADLLIQESVPMLESRIYLDAIDG